VLQIPIAHAEGRLTLGGKSAERLAELERNKQIVFTYCGEGGEKAQGYPENPNGSLADIAGITNPQGNVLGMMPHPERVIHAHQMADWTRKKYEEGDGAQIFQSIKEKIEKQKIN
ncbi:MAG: phosphoribosylformylglycinamidine synthase subunit PurQ, partial [Candidatus Altiarchaeales archaeon]|nr:phosphoribosylformylglycinamidine synthase subunit PurQ [Candidatus Altiarchaeales archaeon]